jgi:hypothetical protein
MLGYVSNQTERTLQMNGNDVVEFLIRHLPNQVRTNKASVIDQDVDAMKIIERVLNDAPAALKRRHAVSVSNGIAPRRLDFSDGVGGRGELIG